MDRGDEKASEWKKRKKEGGPAPWCPDLKQVLCVQRVFSAVLMHTTQRRGRT